MKNRRNLFLAAIFWLFLVFTLPRVTIPVSIGEHTYTGSLCDRNSGTHCLVLAEDGASPEEACLDFFSSMNGPN